MNNQIHGHLTKDRLHTLGKKLTKSEFKNLLKHVEFYWLQVNSKMVLREEI